MVEAYEIGIAFILEGDTEKVFYLSLLNYLCGKYGAKLEKYTNCSDPDIVYNIKKCEKTVLIKFKVVNTVSQMPSSSKWFHTQCYNKYTELDGWTVFLCYDTDNYKDDVSKFYEGDWIVLRNELAKIAKNVVDIAAAADIEDVLLEDIGGISTYLGSDTELTIPNGKKGKSKMKLLFRSMGNSYHSGERAKALIDKLDMQLLIDKDLVPLKEIEKVIFEL